MGLSKSEQATLADELGREKAIVDQAKARAQAELAKVDPHARRVKEISDELVAAHRKEPPEAQIAVEGEQFIVIISPKENKREILGSTEKFYKLLGRAKFFDLWRPTLAGLEKLLPKPKFDECVKEERTGPRTIKVVAKGA